MASMNLIRSALQILLSYFLLFSTNYNNGVEGGRRLISKEEDIEFEKQLKLLNKPAVKTIQTKFGDIYDCVDFYKQPAFDHPLLKNHTFHPQMRPSSVPQLMSDEELFKFSSKEFDIGFNKGVERCPSGTVPIRRVTKYDLIRERLHSEIRYGSKYSVLTIENPGTHYAMVQTTFDPNKKYNGGSTFISVYHPSGVVGSQYSSSRMKIQNGLESIQAGWTVNPTLYGDSRTRLYIYSNAGQLRCFDTRCPGFVVVDTSVILGGVLNVSQIGSGETSLINLSIFRDAPVGNWWFGSADGKSKVGFWPHKLFSSLADLATSVEWGGEVFSPPDVPSPPMGSGGSLKRDTGVDASCFNMKTINESREIMDAINTEVYRDINLYDAVDEGNLGGIWKHVMFFGGPGGATGKK